MIGHKVVVESVAEGEAKCDNALPYFFAEREKGLLEWIPHGKEAGFWEPIVIWDKDPTQRKTRVQLEDLIIIGIQARSRFVVQAP
jgi:hypothetical protein